MPEEGVSLRDYLETCLKSIEDKIVAQTRYIEQHFELNEVAIKKAEEAMLTRLDSMNGFRSQINSERSNYVTKETQEVRSAIVDTRLKKLEMTGAFSAGKLWMFMALFAAVPTILALIALFKE